VPTSANLAIPGASTSAGIQQVPHLIPAVSYILWNYCVNLRSSVVMPLTKIDIIVYIDECIADIKKGRFLWAEEVDVVLVCGRLQ